MLKIFLFIRYQQPITFQQAKRYVHKKPYHDIAIFSPLLLSDNKYFIIDNCTML